ncbi:UNVERIFIED_CONTAM: hypothetical protein FKN15_052744 [Acipenser sinensis]
MRRWKAHFLRGFCILNDSRVSLNTRSYKNQAFSQLSPRIRHHAFPGERERGTREIRNFIWKKGERSRDPARVSCFLGDIRRKPP